MAYGTEPDPTGWTGWIVFASFMMFLLGTFQAIQGLVAIFDDGYYAVTESGLVVDVDYTAWGWVHLLLGVLIVSARRRARGQHGRPDRRRRPRRAQRDR